VQSNWIRDKGYGMGAYVPKLVSPVTGQPEAAPGSGYVFEDTEPNLRRWRSWWRVANQEQLVSFVLITIVTIVLMALGILDYTRRMVAGVLKVSYLRHSERWSESKIYFIAVWVGTAWSAVILLAIQSQPLILLIISASIGGFMMFVYSALLILVNRRSLPSSVRIRGARLVAMVCSVLLFGVFSLVAIQGQWDKIKQLLGLG
jgi:hypothetical protein